MPITWPTVGGAVPPPIDLGKGDPRSRLMKMVAGPVLQWNTPPEFLGSTLNAGGKGGGQNGGGLATVSPGGGQKGGASAGNKGGAFSFNSGGGQKASGGGGGGGNDGGGSNGGGSSGGIDPQARAGQGGGATAYPLWYPMCLFMGDHVSQGEGNKAVKGLVDEAAACGVNLVVFPITTKNIPYNPDAINSAQSSSCNLVDAFGRLGVTHGSTSTCAPFPDIAGWMCQDRLPDPPAGPGGWNPAVKGCAVLAKSNPGDIERQLRDAFLREGLDPDRGVGLTKFNKRMEEIQKDMNNSGGSDGVLPSIEEGSSCSPGIVGHEALGHSMWGHPNGESDGNGIGFSVDAGSGEGGSGSGWTPAGCTAMRGAAYPNDGRWKYDPNRQQYYVKENDPGKQWDLMSGRKVFRPPTPPPPPGRRSQPPPITGGGGGNIVYNEGAPKQPPPSGGGGGGGSPAASDPASPAQPPATAGIPHKKRPQDMIVDALVGDLKNVTPAQASELPPIPADQTGFPPPSPKGAGSARITYDEGASKVRLGSAGSGVMKPTVDSAPPPGEGFGGSTSLTYDEGAPKGQGDSGAPVAVGSGSGKGSSKSLTYDESAAKGQASGSGSGSGVIRLGAAAAEAGAAAAAGSGTGTGLGDLPGPGGAPGATIPTLRLGPGGAASASSSLSSTSDFFRDGDATVVDADTQREEKKKRLKRASGDMPNPRQKRPGDPGAAGLNPDAAQVKSWRSGSGDP
jgi:hypothetical protein